MPIYEYRCDDCDRLFETLVRPGHEDDAQCPSCDGVKISRQMSVFASGRSGDGAAFNTNGVAMGGGGCCGGSCGCH